ncbi:MAG: hypothetical protein FJW30_13995 [Acidobacteria bacterium]|nr:hypothetical protein [Acidobacteriota bacterium]
MRLAIAFIALPLLAIDEARLIRDAAGKVIEADFTATWISDGDLARVAAMKELRVLRLGQTKIGDAGLERLRELREVRELDLYYAEYITDDGLAHLREWKKLTRLNLRGTRVTSKAFPHLAALTGLRWLDIGFTQVDDEGFEELPALEHLGLGGNRLSGSCLAALRSMTTLKSLDAGGTQRVDSGLWGLALNEQNLGRLAGLKSIERLSLAAATINDRGIDKPGHPEAERADLRDLSALAGLPALAYLDLSRQPVTGESIRTLRGLPALRELRLGLAAKIDDAAVEEILALPEMRKVWLSGSAATPPALEKLAKRFPAF